MSKSVPGFMSLISQEHSPVRNWHIISMLFDVMLSPVSGGKARPVPHIGKTIGCFFSVLFVSLCSSRELMRMVSAELVRSRVSSANDIFSGGRPSDSMMCVSESSISGS